MPDELTVDARQAARNKLAQAVRGVRDNLNWELRGEIGLTARQSELLADADALLMTLARMIEGKTVPEAFGAPGDWGYGGPIGDALAALYTVWRLDLDAGVLEPAPEGVRLIAKERREQLEKHGFDEEHDSRWDGGELAMAATYYVMPKPIELPGVYVRAFVEPEAFFPYLKWSFNEWGHRDRKDRVKQLSIAGALIAAEIDRLLALGREGE